MILKNTKQQAFTIVELLIVIVVIGILAAISIVSYNGIQDRARDTSVKNSASQVRTKIEVWNGVMGSYPEVGPAATETSVLGGLNSDEVLEARIDDDVITMLIEGDETDLDGATHSSDGAGTIAVESCGTPIAGMIVHFYQSGGPDNMTVGSVEACS